MDVIDKLLKEISYKFPKGYPDMGNPKDVELLNELAGLFGEEEIIKKEEILLEGNDDYDSRIRQVLGLDKDQSIPQCKTPLKVGKNFQLKGECSEIWDKLYSILPLKKDSNIPSAGAGKGEVSTYWAFQYNSVKPHEVEGAPKGGRS